MMRISFFLEMIKYEMVILYIDCIICFLKYDILLILSFLILNFFFDKETKIKGIYSFLNYLFLLFYLTIQKDKALSSLIILLSFL